jgi:hypothetical protein
MNEKSNVHLTSNVYVVRTSNERIDFAENSEFVSRVVEREALIKLFAYLHGIDPDNRALEYYKGHNGLSDWQIKRIDVSDECAYSPGEKPWGIIIHDGSFREECKCKRKNCEHYLDCRPDERKRNGSEK